jgi:hypothetical protein
LKQGALLNWFIEIPKEQYEQLEEALKEMNTPYRNAEEFVIEPNTRSTEET